MTGSGEKTWTTLRGFAHGFLMLSGAEGCTLADGTPLNLSEKDSTGWDGRTQFIFEVYPLYRSSWRAL